MRSLALPFVIVWIFAAPFAAWADEKVYVFNWSEYIPDAVIAKFQKETGIKLIYSTYDSNDAMYAKVKVLKGDTYDIVVPSTFYVQRMAEEGLLQPLDKSLLSNFANLDENLLDKPSDPGNTYSVPYLWGSTAICVNASKIDPATITSWNDLWRPELKDSLLLIDDIREVFALGLKVSGYSINETDPKRIEEAYMKLTKLMPNVRVFSAETLVAPFLSGEVNIGMNWNGEVYRASNEYPNITYVYPEEGAFFWMDSMVILKNAKNMKNAHAFMDFVMRPEIARMISEEYGYASPNKKAIALMDESLRKNETVYPPPDVIRKGEFFQKVGESVVTYEKFYQKLKAGQ